MVETLFPFIAIVAFIAIAIVIAKISGNRAKKKKQDTKELNNYWVSKGFATEAVITKSESFGSMGPSHHNRVEMFKLEIQYADESGNTQIATKDAGRSTYQEPNKFYDEFFMVESRASYRLKKVGNKIPIIVHPDDPTQIYFDRDKLEKEEDVVSQQQYESQKN